MYAMYLVYLPVCTRGWYPPHHSIMRQTFRSRLFWSLLAEKGLKKGAGARNSSAASSESFIVSLIRLLLPLFFLVTVEIELPESPDSWPYQYQDGVSQRMRRHEF